MTALPLMLCADPPAGVAIVPLPGFGRTVEAVVRAGTETHPGVAAALDALKGISGRPQPV